MAEILFRKIIATVQQEQNVALASLISSKGSFPMSTRAKMLVFQDGSIMGTIGGGSLEATVIQEAQQALATQTPKIIAIDLTSEQIEADGLTCGGVVEILIECFTPETPFDILEEITNTYAASHAAVVATQVDGAMTAKMLVRSDGTYVGTFGDEPIDAIVIQHACAHIGQEYLKTQTLEISQTSQIRVFFETILPPPTAYLFGGGHISLHLSKLLETLDFSVVIIDDRPEFANAARFPKAKDCLVHAFDHVFDVLQCEPSLAYIVILTRGHKSDLIVLKQALRTNAKYIGMIGSARKIKLLFQHLQAQSFSKETLDRVHAPIGLAIGADTPEEIAISIAAEMIKVRRCGE